MDSNELVQRISNTPGTWSVSVKEIGTESSLFEINPNQSLISASSAKVGLLFKVANEVAHKRMNLAQRFSKEYVKSVGGSGLWQHLLQNELCVGDLAKLVGYASDNLATNVLLKAVGMSETDDIVRSLGVDDVIVHDIIRDFRDETTPYTFSTGSAEGYRSLFEALHAREHEGDVTGSLTMEWLRGGVDLSMVAGAFGLDPLSHHENDRGIELVHKTGSDNGVRADSGIVGINGKAIVYSCLVNWTPDESDTERDVVVTTLRKIGYFILDAAVAS